MRVVLSIVSVILLTGCVPQGHFHYADSGRIVTADPVRLKTFEIDKAICNGEASKAALTSRERDPFLHSDNVNLVFQGCMAQKGYVVRPAA